MQTMQRIRGFFFCSFFLCTHSYLYFGCCSSQQISSGSKLQFNTLLASSNSHRKSGMNEEHIRSLLQVSYSARTSLHREGQCNIFFIDNSTEQVGFQYSCQKQSLIISFVYNVFLKSINI